MRTLLAVGALLSSSALAAPAFDVKGLHKRAIITSAQLQPSYDFIIAGGGLSGLVLASRLSEDANKTVLVLEAGDTGDDVRARIDVPATAYFNGLMHTSYDWQYVTQPQPNLAGRNVSWPGGKVIGGSAAMNGMYMVRPSAPEFDMMAQMQNGQPGAAAWNWNSMYAAMRKASSPGSLAAT
ncbi:hypothetical protein FRB99_008015 [Tulasnella sp. 403]|nr:hypothetical protein FRB99_008015 [Tulasnella sp. 403]